LDVIVILKLKNQGREENTATARLKICYAPIIAKIYLHDPLHASIISYCPMDFLCRENLMLVWPGERVHLNKYNSLLYILHTVDRGLEKTTHLKKLGGLALRSGGWAEQYMGQSRQETYSCTRGPEGFEVMCPAAMRTGIDRHFQLKQIAVNGVSRTWHGRG